MPLTPDGWLTTAGFAAVTLGLAAYEFEMTDY